MDTKRFGFMKVLCVSLPLVFAAGCATEKTTTSGAVGVERQQTMLLSSAEVNAQAAQAYASVIAEAKGMNALNRNAVITQRVRRVFTRLIPKTSTFRADAPGWQWEVNVISSDEVNAWCMPGGKMAFYTAIVENLKMTDDEIAAVMGHEMAHALREHGREKASQAAGVSVLSQIGGKIISARTGISSDTTQKALEKVGDLAFMRPNSREMEQESDRIGVELAARAGYNPKGAITLWEKMAKLSEGSGPEWLSTHPSHTARIADLTVYAERVMPLYQEARGGGRGRVRAAPAKK
ncbi:MAG: M48 family metallopeptidase [Candidatus Accumulibacter sp.]|jgi:predicted Zn-dependent protease|nr:M48 family metallopeptidase [Accumulibacter sp.]